MNGAGCAQILGVVPHPDFVVEVFDLPVLDDGDVQTGGDENGFPAYPAHDVVWGFLEFVHQTFTGFTNTKQTMIATMARIATRNG